MIGVVAHGVAGFICPVDAEIGARCFIADNQLPRGNATAEGYADRRELRVLYGLTSRVQNSTLDGPVPNWPTEEALPSPTVRSSVWL
jgi:hypothetical protein